MYLSVLWHAFIVTAYDTPNRTTPSSCTCERVLHGWRKSAVIWWPFRIEESSSKKCWKILFIRNFLKCSNDHLPSVSENRLVTWLRRTKRRDMTCYFVQYSTTMLFKCLRNTCTHPRSCKHAPHPNRTHPPPAHLCTNMLRRGKMIRFCLLSSHLSLDLDSNMRRHLDLANANYI